MHNIGLGVLFVFVATLVALRFRVVDRAGAVAGASIALSFVVSDCLVGLALLSWLVLSSAVSTRVGWSKKLTANVQEANGGVRGWRNVVGKGGAPAVSAIASLVSPTAEAAMLTAFCCAVSDTLATEIGKLSSAPPLKLWPLRRVPVGTPGAISLLGVLSGVVGAAATGGIGLAGDLPAHWCTLAAVIGGTIGSIFESEVSQVLSLFRSTPGWMKNFASAGMSGVVTWVFLQGWR